MTPERNKSFNDAEDNVLWTCMDLKSDIYDARRHGYETNDPENPSRTRAKRVVLRIEQIRKSCKELEDHLRKFFP